MFDRTMPSVVLSDPEIMSGTRVPVKTLFDYLEHGHPLDEFLDDFPTVEKEQALARSRKREPSSWHRSMRLLLDESMPRRFGRALAEHHVATVQSPVH